MSEPFDDDRLPDGIEQGAQGGPTFSTNVLELSSGREVRNRNWKYSRAVYTIGYGTDYFDADDGGLLEVYNHFQARAGRWRSFPFKDYLDYSVTGQQIGVGDGTNKNFYLVKTYTSGPVTYSRPITRPVAGTLAVYKNGVLQSTGYTLNTLGEVSFTAAPANGVVMTADFEFDVPVRYDTDEFSATLETFEAGSIPSLPLKEVIERDT